MVSIFKNAASAAAFLMALSANAHMVMKSPVPYGKSTLNNSPLDPSGSDFPCKQRPGVYDAEGAQNIMQIGQPQTLSFTGSAVHGGGSCQVALTTDLQPTKQSKWMVIKSIEGGCPASVAGNLPADPNGSGASTFEFTIPPSIAPGEYTIAWTWFNKVGNREMYMNCGPASLRGSSAKRSRIQRIEPPAQSISKRQDSFPDLFVANIGNGCSTPESFDYVFPNPGSDVQTVGNGPFTTLACGGSGAGGPAQKPTGAPQAPTGAPNGAPGGPTGAPVTVVPGNPGPTGAGSPGTLSFAYGNGGGAKPTGAPQAPPAAQPGVFGSGAASPASAATGAPAAFTAPAAAPAPAIQTGSGSPNTSNSGNSSGTASNGSCTAGDWKCSADGQSFARCVAGGTWSVNMQMAAGMQCAPGVSANLDMTPVKAVKRSHSHHFRHWF